MYVELDVTNVNHEFLGGDEWGEPAWLGNEEILVYTAKRHPPHWQEEDKRKRYQAPCHSPETADSPHSIFRLRI